MEDHIQRINRFTTISSHELQKEKKHWRLLDALFRPAFRFFRSYVLKGGFLEGFAAYDERRWARLAASAARRKARASGGD